MARMMRDANIPEGVDILKTLVSATGTFGKSTIVATA
jgi:hypothetical protein